MSERWGGMWMVRGSEIPEVPTEYLVKGGGD